MFGPKFSKVQLEALAKCIVEYDSMSDQAITECADELCTENIPLTSEFTPISFLSFKKKRKSIIRNNFNMGVIRGLAWQFSDHEKYEVDDRYILKLIKQALKKSELLGLESSLIYKSYRKADRDENWGKGVFFSKIFLKKYQGVSEDMII